MTRFTVIYEQEAEEQLASLWLSHFDRDEVAEASRSIDVRLRDDPRRNGTPIGNKRDELGCQAGPLIAIYTISDGDMLVQVWKIMLVAN
ncbi:hypothetical protein [Stratiformator vulcanicus]|uniref:Plasmid stabilization system protein n=1 Tax=Stratiformator vulcanicus TaxID=2527980 RepID=A0A517QYS4_9PLAN|nr:hypothetical protein [Stratiformator vulcanicus]QDT36690.1 hypothetical protein Pan189_10520 [Stratiformator vulcanicus]